VDTGMAYATENKGLQSMKNTSIRTISHCTDQLTAELNGTEYLKKEYFTPHSLVMYTYLNPLTPNNF
jgi:hypothetical protein